MEKSVSLLRYLRQLAYEKDKTLSSIDELDFFMYLDELPKNSTYISLGSGNDDFILRIKRPFSSKTMEERKLQALYREYLKLYYTIENETKEVELLLGNAILQTNSDEAITYPVFTKRVNIHLNAQKEILEVRDSNVPARLDVKLLSKVGNINPLELKRAAEELNQSYYHPLSGKETTSFLRGLAKRLHLEGNVVEDPAGDYAISPLTLLDRNLFLLAPKHSAAYATYDKIVEWGEEGKIHPIIKSLSGEESAALKPSDLEEGEGLFTKEFNREQLNIVKNSYENTVTLVDGPPGSGKTHTVANMIGHFLAEGKRVLILSKKKKALRVLKNMIDPAFNGLVVSRVTDSNEDIKETLYYINEFIANHTTPEMEAKARRMAEERKDILRRMEEAEGKVLDILQAEGEVILYDKEEITPVEAARFVRDHEDLLSVFPGQLEELVPMPLDKGELDFLYTTNREITPEEELLLNRKLPTLDDVLSPHGVEEILSKLDMLEFEILKYKPLAVTGTETTEEGVKVGTHVLTESGDFTELYQDLEELRHYTDLPLWEENALKAGLNIIDNKAYGELSRLAVALDEFREKNMDIITGRTISHPDLPRAEIIRRLQELYDIFGKKDHLGTLDTMFNRNRKKISREFLINGEPVSNQKEADEAIVLMNYEILLSDFKAVYKELIEKGDGPAFDEDYFRNKDKIFARLEDLYGFKDLYLRALHGIENAGVPKKLLHKIAPARENPTAEVLSYLSGDMYNLLKVMEIHNGKILPLEQEIERTLEVLRAPELEDIRILSTLRRSLEDRKLAAYREDYEEYAKLIAKQEIAHRRKELYKKMDVAPTWREFVEKRFGIHGEGHVPENIETAWRVKQLNAQVEKLVKVPYEKLRKMLSWYKKSIIETNREYAKTLAWYHFLRRMDENPEIRQTLKGLELTYKKLGKGTGREAKELRAKAEELLLTCQQYVPCWVMTIDDALVNVAPREEFDITVVDEASQADILSLPLVYTAPKLIAIGDDRQTTPIYPAISSQRVEDLRAVSLANDFPNYHLMDLTTSLYDVLKATYPSFLLKEQFRSVPEIIEYSNRLSYEGKILPLRDGSDSHIKPALMLVKVDGKRDGEENKAEAEYIISKIRDIIEDPLYDGKTIGVITLVGEKQAKAIEERLMDLMDVAQYHMRKIMVGTPTDFQGDERDIMFISMVDSPEDKPLRLVSEGAEELTKKRYNVAFSRARDQEFLVTSLEPAHLKTGDLRQWTLEYFLEMGEKTNEDGDVILEQNQREHVLTPFQEEVRDALIEQGFQVSSHHSAGNYPLPLVVEESGKVAIITSGNEGRQDKEELRENLYRTLILERVGWKLAHVRESKFTYDKEDAVDELIENIRNKR